MKSKLLSFALLYSVLVQAQVLEPNPSNFPITQPAGFNIINDKFIYIGTTTTNGRELWATDGTSSGNALLKEIGNYNNFQAGSAFTFIDANDTYGKFGKFNGKIYFTAGTSNYFGNLDSFWTTDGTTSGTALLGPVNSLLNIRFFKEFNGRLYFSAYDPVNGGEIWSTDGTWGGTTLLKDINPGTNSSVNPIYDPHFTILNDKMYFVANDGVHGYELWSTDGTAAGTSLLKDIRTNENADINLGGAFVNDLYSNLPFKVVNNKIYFGANDNNSGPNFYVSDSFILYETDGTTNGTKIVEAPLPDYSTCSCGSPTYNYIYNLKGLTSYNDKLFVFGQLAFHSFGGIQNGGVYQLDGSNPITRLKGFGSNAGDSGTSDETERYSMRLFEDNFYFLGSDNFNAPNSLSLWKMNPTTFSFTQITPVPANSDQGFNGAKLLVATEFNNKMYFLKSNEGSLFSTDGSISGTEPAAKNPTTQSTGSVSSAQNMTVMPTELKVFNNALYFQAQFGATQPVALWRLNAGTLSTVENKTLNLQLYPNPTTGMLHLDLPNHLQNAEVRITSTTGQMVFREVDLNGANWSRDVSDLASGVYLISVTNKDSTFHSKFIKQ